MLDRLCPYDEGFRDIIDEAHQDSISISVKPKEIASVATEADILTLVRCGVFWDSDIERISMFV